MCDPLLSYKSPTRVQLRTTTQMYTLERRCKDVENTSQKQKRRFNVNSWLWYSVNAYVPAYKKAKK